MIFSRRSRTMRNIRPRRGRPQRPLVHARPFVMPEGGTWFDLARRVCPEATDVECHQLLWACSPYPFAPPEMVERTMRETFINGGGTVAGAVNYSHEELDRVWTACARSERILQREVETAE